LSLLRKGKLRDTENVSVQTPNRFVTLSNIDTHKVKTRSTGCYRSRINILASGMPFQFRLWFSL